MLRALNRLVIAALGRLLSALVSSPLPLYRLLAVTGQAQRIGTRSLRGCRLKMAIEDYCDYAILKRWSDAERETLDWIDSFEPNSVLLDVGAQIGRVSLYAAARFRGMLSVYAIDPDARVTARLARNVELNSLGSQVRVLLLAASDADGEAELVFDYGTQQGHLGSARQATDGAQTYSYVVTTMTIDTMRARGLVRAPNYIKVDVDGDEVQVIRGALETLALDELRSILIEVSSRTKAEVVRLLERQNLRLTSAAALSSPSYENLVFEPLSASALPARPSRSSELGTNAHFASESVTIQRLGRR